MENNENDVNDSTCIFQFSLIGCPCAVFVMEEGGEQEGKTSRVGWLVQTWRLEHRILGTYGSSEARQLNASLPPYGLSPWASTVKIGQQ